MSNVMLYLPNLLIASQQCKISFSVLPTLVETLHVVLLLYVSSVCRPLLPIAHDNTLHPQFGRKMFQEKLYRTL